MATHDSTTSSNASSINLAKQAMKINSIAATLSGVSATLDMIVDAGGDEPKICNVACLLSGMVDQLNSQLGTIALELEHASKNIGGVTA